MKTGNNDPRVVVPTLMPKGEKQAKTRLKPGTESREAQELANSETGINVGRERIPRLYPPLYQFREGEDHSAQRFPLSPQEERRTLCAEVSPLLRYTSVHPERYLRTP